MLTEALYELWNPAPKPKPEVDPEAFTQTVPNRADRRAAGKTAHHYRGRQRRRRAYRARGAVLVLYGSIVKPPRKKKVE